MQSIQLVTSVRVCLFALETAQCHVDMIMQPPHALTHSPIHSFHAMHVQTGWTMGSGLLAVVAGKALMSVGVVTVPLVTLPLMMGTSIVIGGASS
jgi:hypothetical protein